MQNKVGGKTDNGLFVKDESVYSNEKGSITELKRIDQKTADIIRTYYKTEPNVDTILSSIPYEDIVGSLRRQGTTSNVSKNVYKINPYVVYAYLLDYYTKLADTTDENEYKNKNRVIDNIKDNLTKLADALKKQLSNKNMVLSSNIDENRESISKIQPPRIITDNVSGIGGNINVSDDNEVGSEIVHDVKTDYIEIKQNKEAAERKRQEEEEADRQRQTAEEEAARQRRIAEEAEQKRQTDEKNRKEEELKAKELADINAKIKLQEEEAEKKRLAKKTEEEAEQKRKEDKRKTEEDTQRKNKELMDKAMAAYNTLVDAYYGLNEYIQSNKISDNEDTKYIKAKYKSIMATTTNQLVVQGTPSNIDKARLYNKFNILIKGQYSGIDEANELLLQIEELTQKINEYNNKRNQTQSISLADITDTNKDKTDNENQIEDLVNMISHILTQTLSISQQPVQSPNVSIIKMKYYGTLIKNKDTNECKIDMKSIGDTYWVGKVKKVTPPYILGKTYFKTEEEEADTLYEEE